MITQRLFSETPNLPPETPPDVTPLAIPMVSMREDRWEYRRIVRDLESEEPPTEGELNDLGAEGWELTGAFSDSRQIYFYFKRLA